MIVQPAGRRGVPFPGGPLYAILPKKGGMLCVERLTPDDVLGELAAIAFAEPGAERGGQAVKVADKLRALELLYKHLGLGDGQTDEGVTIIDEA